MKINNKSEFYLGILSGTISLIIFLLSRIIGFKPYIYLGWIGILTGTLFILYSTEEIKPAVLEHSGREK